MNPTNRPIEIHADAEFVAEPVEVFNIEEQKNKLLASDSDYVSITRNALDDSLSFLPFFAEKYNISADRKDYILAPVTIFLSDIPNKKGHCFTSAELLSADPYLGQLKYKTWERMPTYVDHNNKDHTKAKGIILNASMMPARNVQGDLYKVVLLQAFDRSTYPEIGNGILSGKYKSYSMGANASSFKCSICSSDVPHSKCGHIPRGMLDGSGFNFTTVGDKLAYLEAQDIKGFECSVLTKNNPANPVSWHNQDAIMKFDG